ncbi:hypothetical protein BGZ65_007864 [Modicella reniformis]|uniref:DUF6589 domain-containing protein n=1 Tax=Modicella reniformis TaxID=1440133 RepID=A0A9P6M8C1_9FUNG|nr:hypothetical protein BGZ65_007864 [Modicella reniformis]
MGTCGTRYTKLDTRLNAIFDVLDQHDMNIKSFLEGCFRSRNKRILTKVSYFYQYDGPSSIIDEWFDNITEPDDVRGFLGSAVDFVVKHVNVELDEASSDPKLKLAASAITVDKVQKFKLRYITKRFEIYAPNVLRLLRGLTKVDEAASKDPDAIIPTIGSMLVFLRNRRANFFQANTGLYVFSKGAPRRLIDFLSRLGISVSHQSILRGMESLSKDAQQRLRAEVREKAWYLVYDNINMACRKYDQRLTNQDSFESGTTATVIITEKSAEEERDRNPVRHLCPKDLMLTSENDKHFRDVIRSHLVAALQRNIKTFEKCSIPPPTKKLLPARRTTAYPLPAMDINQSSVRGNKDVIEKMAQDILQLDPELFDGLRIIIAGDQLTVLRLRSLIRIRMKDVSPFHRMEWIIPVMQLFHLQMLLGATILRNHYGSLSTPGSVAFYATLLKRKRVGLEKPDFHATDELLRHVFDAMALRAWELVLNCHGLQTFTCDDPRPTKAKLMGIIETKVDDLIERFLVMRNIDKLDTASKNAAIFLRDMLLYIELSSAIKVGDVGRLEEVIKMLTIFFQGGANKNYAAELLHLHCGLSYCWTKNTKEAVLSSWLVNTTGKKDGWMPADLHQEHMNRAIKMVYAAKGSRSSWSSLQTISTNINTLRHIQTRVESEFNVYHGTDHATTASDSDINRVWRSIREYGILGNPPQHVTQHHHSRFANVKPVKDLYEEGMVKLMEGERIEKFKTCHAMFDGVDAEDNSMDLDIECEPELVFDIEDYVQATAE